MGPARSASSIMCSSTRRRGLRTVNDLSRICWKLMPSSARYEKRFGLIREFYLQEAGARPLHRLCRTRSTMHLGIECCLQRLQAVGRLSPGLGHQDLFVHSNPVVVRKIGEVPVEGNNLGRRRRSCPAATLIKSRLESNVNTCLLFQIKMLSLIWFSSFTHGKS